VRLASLAHPAQTKPLWGCMHCGRGGINKEVSLSLSLLIGSGLSEGALAQRGLEAVCIYGGVRVQHSKWVRIPCSDMVGSVS